VDETLRDGCRRSHTATHLLHAALRQVVGTNVTQAGSLVAPDRLRFDFTHHSPLTPEQTQSIEDFVNAAIEKETALSTVEMLYKEAIKGSDVMHLFNEKYADRVRVVDVPGLSKELCGGTHVKNTGNIDTFKILSERSIATGT
jgi:alanyl-tRNA synthetase